MRVYNFQFWRANTLFIVGIQVVDKSIDLTLKMRQNTDKGGGELEIVLGFWVDGRCRMGGSKRGLGHLDVPPGYPLVNVPMVDG